MVTVLFSEYPHSATYFMLFRGSTPTGGCVPILPQNESPCGSSALGSPSSAKSMSKSSALGVAALAE